jgi:glycosyltransferase involved in cell wall biosynthesis
MKIAINATCYDDRPSGATQRFKGIYRALFKRLSNTEFIVFEPRDCKISSWFDKHDNVSFRSTPLSSQDRIHKFLRGLRYWPPTLRKEECDVFDVSNLPFIRSPKGQTALTIQDIRYVSHAPGMFSKSISKVILTNSVAKCDRLIVVSESIRDEILSFYPDLPVSVVYNGVDPSSFQAISSSDLCSVRRRYNLPDDFILSVGHFEQRKNYITLVTALARLRDKGRAIYLVIVGNDNGDLAAVQGHIYSLGLTASVQVLNGLSNLEVSCLYKLSRLFVFPSYYEGFGIPILEAMAAGCPMVLSEIPVFKELTQGRGVYFQHNSPESIGTAIDDILSSTSKREQLKQYGDTRVQDFTFEKASMALEEVYKALV